MKNFKIIFLSLIAFSSQLMAKDYCRNYTPELIEEMYCEGKPQDMLEFIAQNCREVAERASIAADELDEIIDQAKTHEERMTLYFASIDLNTKASRALSVATQVSLLKFQKGACQ